MSGSAGRRRCDRPVKLALMTGALAVIALVIDFFVGETSWHSVSIILLVAVVLLGVARRH